MKVKKMQRTKIEWATHTWNPIVGCSKISDGCLNCYAEAMVHRFPWMTGTHYPDDTGNNSFGWDGLAHFFPERLEEPFHLRPGKDRPHRIFVCSMSDLFHESLSNEQIAAVFGVMAATPQHQYVVLTKRLQRALEWFDKMCREYGPSALPYGHCRANKAIQTECVLSALKFGTHAFLINPSISDSPPPWPLPNVIIGTSVEDFRYHPRIDDLRRIPATKRIISFEPMLGPITANLCGIDLVICGAETGSKKRPFKDEWALDLRDQCKAAGTHFFFKKDGHGNQTLCGVEYHEWIE
jgi:protein gp37